MKTKKRKLALRFVQLLSSIILITAILVFVAFSRFYFPNQHTPLLAWLQSNNGPAAVMEHQMPTIIGHRGSAIESADGARRIGNTINAIQRGIDAGVDWIEVDIQLTGDKQLVLFHDERLDLKTNHDNANDKVADLSLEQLKALSVNVEPVEKIQTLEEVFARFNAVNVKWILDIKVNGIHKHVLAWIENKIAQEKLSSDQLILFGTFDILSEYKDADCKLGYTATWSDFGNRLRVLFHQSDIIKRCKILDCDFLVLPAVFANQSLVREADNSGSIVWVYGTDNALDLGSLANRGVKGFIVDRPLEILEPIENKKITR